MTHRPSALALALVLLAATRATAAENPSTYSVARLVVAPGVGSVEFPVGSSFSGELDVGLLATSSFANQNPFDDLSLVTPVAWLHFDGVRNLRLSAAYQEIIQLDVPALGLASGHEERGVVRARLQQPRGAGALYEIVQLDVRSLDDAGGTHRVVFRPRFRIGQGFNLDAVRVHSVTFFEEIALAFSSGDYVARPFEFFRAFAGYSWTTRRHGTYVSLGLLGQIALNPPATAYTFAWGPALSIQHRFRAKTLEAPAAPPEVTVQ